MCKFGYLETALRQRYTDALILSVLSPVKPFDPSTSLIRGLKIVIPGSDLARPAHAHALAAAAPALGCVVRIPELLGAGQAPLVVLPGTGQLREAVSLGRRIHGRGTSPARRRLSC